ncbi:hypothetical protein KS4_21810 [Poriferisphaera corsica]|uniref:Uncharacterized protein n=1 Tax=Poriferisphaera corsica TaxID=2528020 RepID=A0A517YV57_9BACT|nr:hypothetical protein [Poriferisphaera corsica]QDU34119.1 hypothetical protein KS4_21810 [Poriferisphaera corsica]
MLLKYKLALIPCMIAATTLIIGCGQSHRTSVLIEPTYSFVKEGIQLVDRSDTRNMQHVRFAKKDHDEQSND